MSTFTTQLPCEEGVVNATRAVAVCTRRAAPWILAAMVIASSMAFINNTVVNVALPALQKDLDASLVDAQWVIEAYALLQAALLLVGGAAGDRYGRRLVFLSGIVLFATASIWCGLAGNARELILARVVQGIGSGLLVPGSLSIIGASFSEQERGKAIGLWSGATAITGALGPGLGGWLIDHFSWRAAFFINIPLAAAVIVISLWHVPESRNPQAKHLDWLGAILVTLGLSGVVFGLIESSNRGWTNSSVIGALAAGVLLLACFAVAEYRQAAPMVPPRLFRSRTFLGANLLTLLLYSALGGGLFFLPLDLIQVQGYSATAAGAALLPFIALLAILSRWSGGLVDRYGAKMPLVVGPLVAAVGFALFAVPGVGGSYWTTFFPAIAVLGLGMAISVAPLTTVVLNSVDAAFEGAASGINNAASRIAVVVAIAVFGIFFAFVFNRSLDTNLQRAQLPAALVETVQQQRSMLGAIELPAGISADDKAAARHAIADAFTAGFRLIMIISALLAAASAVIAWAMIESAGRRPAEAT
ncbi:MAG TPA: DHA2 family efflux MFS transporter permease subunit [Xanthobacteraceae bacterium]|nr:DHA2 family efflux MFS transporter permease subunit [Xanthobacteraceae bacterium]